MPGLQKNVAEHFHGSIVLSSVFVFTNKEAGHWLFVPEGAQSVTCFGLG